MQNVEGNVVFHTGYTDLISAVCTRKRTPASGPMKVAESVYSACSASEGRCVHSASRWLMWRLPEWKESVGA
jgi:hypothetical protein